MPADWFAQNAPPASGGDWFSKNAPPVSPPPEKSALSRFGSGLYDSTVGPLVHTAGQVVSGHPVDAITDLFNTYKHVAGVDDAKQIADLVKNGKVKEAAAVALNYLSKGPAGVIAEDTVKPVISDIKSGNYADAGGRILGTAGMLAGPELIAGDTAAGAAIRGGAKGGARAVVETTPVTKFGVTVPVPAILANSAAAGAAGHCIGLPYEAGAAGGAAATVVRGNARGAKEAVRARAAKIAGTEAPTYSMDPWDVEVPNPQGPPPTGMDPGVTVTRPMPAPASRPASGTGSPYTPPEPQMQQPAPQVYTPPAAPAAPVAAVDPALDALAQKSGFQSFAEAPPQAQAFLRNMAEQQNAPAAAAPIASRPAVEVAKEPVIPPAPPLEPATIASQPAAEVLNQPAKAVKADVLKQMEALRDMMTESGSYDPKLADSFVENPGLTTKAREGQARMTRADTISALADHFQNLAGGDIQNVKVETIPGIANMSEAMARKLAGKANIDLPKTPAALKKVLDGVVAELQKRKGTK
jgi:hypothetical protein